MSKEISNSLVNLGGLTKPADTLIKKISNAVGVLYEPRQIRRIAKAKADAALTEAKSKIKITDLHRRAARRWVEEEAQRQKNMEDITAKALSQLNENAKPDSIENDWIVNFFDTCRIVSDNEMQELWSRVLAGEANAPGTYSKRTVNFLSDLDKDEADLFTRLCGFVWVIGDEGRVPLIRIETAEIYRRHGINFDTLSHLASIGLIQFSANPGFRAGDLPKRVAVSYYGRSLTLEMRNNTNNDLDIGGVLLTRIGQELVPICRSKPVEGFWEYAKGLWGHFLAERTGKGRSDG